MAASRANSRRSLVFMKMVCAHGVFGGAAGLKIVAELGIAEAIGAGETMLLGSAAASLCAWWALGFVMQVLQRGGKRRAE